VFLNLIRFFSRFKFNNLINVKKNEFLRYLPCMVVVTVLVVNLMS